MPKRYFLIQHIGLWLILLAWSAPFAQAMDSSQLVSAFDTQINLKKAVARLL